VIETDELVAEPVYISAKAALTWQYIFIVIYVLIQERAVGKLLLCEVCLELLSIQLCTYRLRLVGFIRFLYVPEVASDLITNAGAWQQFVVPLEWYLDPIDSLARVHQILGQVLVRDYENLAC